jgi:hypothetical protein
VCVRIRRAGRIGPSTVIANSLCSCRHLTTVRCRVLRQPAPPATRTPFARRTRMCAHDASRSTSPKVAGSPPNHARRLCPQRCPRSCPTLPASLPRRTPVLCRSAARQSRLVQGIASPRKECQRHGNARDGGHQHRFARRDGTLSVVWQRSARETQSRCGEGSRASLRVDPSAARWNVPRAVANAFG